MIRIFHWETEQPGRPKSVKNLITEQFNAQVQVDVENYYREYEDLNTYLFIDYDVSDHNILFAHTSNIFEKVDLLDVIKRINSSFPTMHIVLYTGGYVDFDADGDTIRIENAVYTIDFPHKQNVISIALGGYNIRDFAEAIHLQKALNELIETNDLRSFSNIILGKDDRLERELANREFCFDSYNFLKLLEQISHKRLVVLWNKPEQQVDSKKHLIFDSLVAFNNFLSTNIGSFAFDAVVIIPEGNWRKHRSGFDGLAVATQLRNVHEIVIPIIFASFFSLPEFEVLYKEEGGHKYNIIFAPSSYFLHLVYREAPISVVSRVEGLLKIAKTLHVAALRDIQTMLLNDIGDLVDRLTHMLYLSKPEKEISWVLNYSERILGKRLSFTGELNKKILAAHKSGNEEIFSTLKDELIRFASNDLQGGNLRAKSSEFIDKGQVSKFKILIVEDSEEYQELLIHHLSERFEITLFGDGDEAVNFLREKDSGQLFNCVISDWRLFKIGSANLWQDRQGYEVLSEIASFHMASLVSLTSEIDRNVHSIRNLLGISITLFKKQHLQNSSSYDKPWEMFADNIEDLCVQNVTLISSQPTGSSWIVENQKNKYVSLRTKYMRQRRINWISFESSLSLKADQCWHYYQSALTDQNPYLRSIEKQFGLSLGDSLENTLVVRRIWLALWFNNYKIEFIGRIMNEEIPEINIYIILKDVNIEEARQEGEIHVSKENKKLSTDLTPYVANWKKKLENNSYVFCNALCIKASGLPSEGILPEERSWLLKHNIKIEKNISDQYY